MTARILPLPARLAEARAQAANPHPAQSPTLRLLAWATLKAARGQRIRQSVAARPITQTVHRRTR